MPLSKHVLVVEDDPIIVDLIRSIVGKLGYACAIEAYQGCCDSAVCVILDYSIPGMDPTRLLSRMREINANVQVLLSSGYSETFISSEFPIDSVAGFIPKPYEPQTLIEALAEVADVASSG